MDKQTYIEKIKASGLRDEAKQKIVTLLETNELDFDTKELIKDILQNDIDADVVELTEEDLVEVRLADEQLEADLAIVENDLKEDMAFAEDELNNLSAMTSDVDKIIDEVQIAAIKADIQG